MEQVLDVITGGVSGINAQGSVANRLLTSGMNPTALRTNDVLRKDEWVQYDTAIVEVARERLIGVADLLNAGLRQPVPNALGKTSLEWERQGDMTPAEINMSGVTEGRGDRLEYNLTAIPLPIIHKDFKINIRALEASRTTGTPLDTTQARLASIIVTESIENILFNGAVIGGTNGTVYGYTSAPNRNTGSVTASWATATGTQIVADVLSMIDDAVTDHMYGPFVIYVPYAAHTHMGDDFKTNSDKTILQRVQEIPGITAVRPSSKLTGTSVLLVQMTSNVVDMIEGFQPMTVQWDEMGGMVMNFKVMSIMVPRIKDDFLTQSGIVHYS